MEQAREMRLGVLALKSPLDVARDAELARVEARSETELGGVCAGYAQGVIYQAVGPGRQVRYEGQHHRGCVPGRSGLEGLRRGPGCLSKTDRRTR